MNLNEKLQLNDRTEEANSSYFRSLVGGSIYLTHSRPNIAFLVRVFSRFMHSPSKHHLGAAKRVLHYIAGTIDFVLWYDNSSNVELFGLTDSNWAGCLEDRRSISVYVFCLG